MPRYCFFFFFCQISRYVSNEQPCLETTGLYKDLLIYVSLFLFHILCSHFIKFMFSNFSISSFFFSFGYSFSTLYQALQRSFYLYVTPATHLGSKITADGDCSHEVKRRLLAPCKKSYDQPREHIKKQRHYFANKGPSSQSHAFFLQQSYIDLRVGL